MDVATLPAQTKMQLIDRLITRQRRNGYIPLLPWTILYRRFLIPGRLFDLTNHLYLVDIYLDTTKIIVVKKSSQLGLSEWLISYAIHACDQRQATVIYVFPSERGISDFSSARLGPALEASPYLESIIVEGREAGSGRQGASRITLKRIRDRFLYLRGGQVSPTGQAAQLKSVDGDVFIADEVDEMDQRAIPIGRKRLGHSQIAEERIISTPSYAGMGIDAEFEQSDQREWFIRCQHCGKWQNVTISHVVIEWDDLERPRAWHGQKEGRAYAACQKCGRELDRLGQGQWVAQYPGREIVGYHPTKFASPAVDLLKIVKNLDTTDETKRREAYNQDLGEIYIPKGGQITDEVLNDCRRDYAHGPVVNEETWMGVDVGKVLHVVIRGPQERETGERPQRWAGEVDTFDELGRTMRRYNVARCVINALPETHKVREFQQSWPAGKVWLAYYPGSDEGTKRADLLQWNEEEGTVTMDRTRSIDETYSRFYEGKNTLPANAQDIPDYYEHLKVLVRVLETKKDGQKVAIYVAGKRPQEGGKKPDHFAHAENYCMAAMEAPKITTATSSRSVSREETGL